MTDPSEVHWRRRLVTIAARDYPYEKDDFAKGIDAQVSVLTDWLTDPTLSGRQFSHKPLNPESRTQIDDFIDHAGLHTTDADDVLVVYVTGHGIKAESGRHYLLLSDSDEANPMATCYRTSTLLEKVLSSDAEHVFVIVDSCHAGALNIEWATMSQDLPKVRRELQSLIIFVSGDFDDRLRIGEFAEVLRLAYERLRSGPAQIEGPYLTVRELLTEIGAVHAQHPEFVVKARKLWPQDFVGAAASTPCLPNPGYTPPLKLVELPRQQVAATPSDLEDYWTSRASGRTAVTDSGWYFSGRTNIMRSMTSFLATGEGILVVTGVAGSGKSAVLARAVTLSDPIFRGGNADIVASIEPSMLPARGCIDAAVLARGKDGQQVCVELLALLGGISTGSAAAYDELKAHLVGTGRSVVLVVDGVDEAIHPERLVAEVLGPLARLGLQERHPSVRLLLGVRSEKDGHDGVQVPDGGQGLRDLLRRAADGVSLDVLRTDEDPAATDDIAAYLAALLNVSGPYTGVVSPQSPVVQIVASHVSPSFLDARLAGKRLRDAEEPQNLADSGWIDTLSKGTLSLFRRDLTDTAHLMGHPVSHVLAVLRATAFAHGRGLPWSDIWGAATAAVLDEPIRDVDQLIDAVLHSRLAGYLTQDIEDGRTVHRPNHERLADELRYNSKALASETQAP